LYLITRHVWFDGHAMQMHPMPPEDREDFRGEIFESIANGRGEFLLAETRHKLNDEVAGNFWRDLLQFAINAKDDARADA
jgi:hypothetical protein